jgi:hypothetical protein
MDDTTKELILSKGVPLDTYSNSFVDLGANNHSALKRLAIIATNIYKYDLPIPPSPFIEFVADKTGGKSKLDFSMVIDGKKGSGKSYSSTYLACRYAMEMADRFGNDPKDYFSIENCALLEDTEKITHLLEESNKQDAIVIDDASIAVGSRDFATQSNKNFNRILAVCRTKRWFVLFNTPVKSHIDLQIRELVDVTSNVYKSFHEGGFNLLKINSSSVSEFKNKNMVIKRRMAFFDRKFDFWVAYSPEMLDPYKGFITKYDAAREAATMRLIHSIAAEEKERKSPVSKREKAKQELFDKHFTVIKTMVETGRSMREMRMKTGLSQSRIDIIRAQGGI